MAEKSELTVEEIVAEETRKRAEANISLPANKRMTKRDWTLVIVFEAILVGVFLLARFVLPGLY